MNKSISKYMSEQGKKGGAKSRRVLTSEQARAMVEAKKAKRTTFDKLFIGEYFRFAKKTKVGNGMYNGTGRKTTAETYRMLNFNGSPQPEIEVIRL